MHDLNRSQANKPFCTRIRSFCRDHKPEVIIICCALTVLGIALLRYLKEDPLTSLYQWDAVIINLALYCFIGIVFVVKLGSSWRRPAQPAEVIAKLGEGGQGTVYRVRIGGKEYALKWYHKGTLQNPRRFYQNLENNIRQGAPSPAFLWPEFLTKERDGSFGYVMKLRPSNYREFSDFLLAKVHFSSLSAAANAVLNITNGFRELHRKGFAQTNDQTAVSQLKDYLPTLSEKGSGDDMSVGIIVNTDFARQKTAAFEKSRQASQNEVTP